MSRPNLIIEDWGVIPYAMALQKQEALFQSIIEAKVNGMKAQTHHLIFCQHPPVFTLGNKGKKEHILIEEGVLREKGIAMYHTKRGGDVTFHGPGQLVIYPIFDLEQLFKDIHKYLRYLEEAVIQTLLGCSIRSGRLAGLTGVWVNTENEKEAKKICAMGVRCSRWVTMHGAALNVTTDLRYFDDIIPCGIEDKGVTSMAKELHEPPEIRDVQRSLEDILVKLFDFQRI